MEDEGPTLNFGKIKMESLDFDKNLELKHDSKLKSGENLKNL